MNWEEIRKEFESSNITLKALAEKHNIKLGTLKSRKSRENWSGDATKKDATPPKKVATLKESVESLVESDELTDKQRLFCLYYVKYFNATKAYQKAYDCSYAVANKNAYTLMVNHGIKHEIDRMKAEQAKGIMLDAQYVLQKYIDIAFSDITDYLSFGRKEIEVGKDENGDPIIAEVNYVEFKDSYNIDGTIVSEVKQGKDGVSIKLDDKMKALDKLSLYFDLFPDKFKRQVEEEKLKLAQRKVNGEDEEEYEDDGFLEALDGKEVSWDEEA